MTKVKECAFSAVISHMDNKDFSKELEKRTKKFAIKIIQLSSNLLIPRKVLLSEGKLQNPAPRLVQTTAKPIEQGAGQISKIKSKFVKLKPVKHNIG